MYQIVYILFSQQKKNNNRLTKEEKKILGLSSSLKGVKRGKISKDLKEYYTWDEKKNQYVLNKQTLRRLLILTQLTKEV